MAEYLSPGVYVEEFESGGKPMEGVGTSTVGFVGLAQRGPVGGVPQLVTNFSDFKRKYGGYLSSSEFVNYRFLSYAVEHFFLNGGSRCFISRVAPPDAVCSSGSIPKDKPLLEVTAKNPGIWANDSVIIITPASKAKTQVLAIKETDAGKRYSVKKSIGFNAGDIIEFNDGTQSVYNRVLKSQDNFLELETDFPETVIDDKLVPDKLISTCEFNIEVRYDDLVEVYENISFNVQASNYIEKAMEKSELVSIKILQSENDESGIAAPFAQLAGSDVSADNPAISVVLLKGSNGTKDSITADVFMGTDNGPGKRTGIQAFIDNDTISLIAVPGVTDPDVQLTLVAHCENLTSRFAVLDMPEDCTKLDDIITRRNIFDSDYAAMYHPWLQVYDPLDKKNMMLPSSGSVLGIYARSDNSRGVHKAPANETVRGCTGLSIPFNKGEQDILNPKGVNLIRAFPGQGIRVWGARTASSNPIWKYINVRRLFIFIEESIKANTSWVVFEPNDENLWDRVKRTITSFLTGMWRNGAFAGSSADEAFFCEIGPSTMSKDDIDNGRLICVIGVAPVKPAEFVIFRLTQKTGDSN